MMVSASGVRFKYTVRSEVGEAYLPRTRPEAAYYEKALEEYLLGPEMTEVRKSSRRGARDHESSTGQRLKHRARDNDAFEGGAQRLP
jgi:hypothetical protein